VLRCGRPVEAAPPARRLHGVPRTRHTGFRRGAGRPLAQRLLATGESVLDVPAKLSARVRLFDTGHNRKTDALDAHSIAIVAVRTEGLCILTVDGSSRCYGCSPTAAKR